VSGSPLRLPSCGYRSLEAEGCVGRQLEGIHLIPGREVAIIDQLKLMFLESDYSVGHESLIAFVVGFTERASSVEREILIHPIERSSPLRKTRVSSVFPGSFPSREGIHFIDNGMSVTSSAVFCIRLARS